jgi:hypothetical protein
MKEEMRKKGRPYLIISLGRAFERVHSDSSNLEELLGTALYDERSVLKGVRATEARQTRSILSFSFWIVWAISETALRSENCGMGREHVGSKSKTLKSAQRFVDRGQQRDRGWTHVAVLEVDLGIWDLANSAVGLVSNVYILWERTSLSEASLEVLGGLRKRARLDVVDGGRSCLCSRREQDHLCRSTIRKDWSTWRRRGDLFIRLQGQREKRRRRGEERSGASHQRELVSKGAARIEGRRRRTSSSGKETDPVRATSDDDCFSCERRDLLESEAVCVQTMREVSESVRLEDRWRSTRGGPTVSGNGLHDDGRYDLAENVHDVKRWGGCCVVVVGSIQSIGAFTSPCRWRRILGRYPFSAFRSNNLASASAGQVSITLQNRAISIQLSPTESSAFLTDGPLGDVRPTKIFNISFSSTADIAYSIELISHIFSPGKAEELSSSIWLIPGQP